MNAAQNRKYCENKLIVKSKLLMLAWRKSGEQAMYFNDAPAHFVCIFQVVRWGN